MPAGTITLTNNSTAVAGSGTNFIAELKVNDFIVAVVGGTTYTLGVSAIGSATAITLTTAYGGPTVSGIAWTPIPNGTLVGITAQVAADTARAIRGLNFDKANWQQVYSSSGNITVKLPDGSSFTGPSWKYLADNMATKVSGAVPVAQGGTGATTVADARTNLSAAASGINTDIITLGQLAFGLTRDNWIPDKGIIGAFDAGSNFGYNIKAYTASVGCNGWTMHSSFGFTIDATGSPAGSGPSIISTDGISYNKFWKFQNGSGAIVSHAGNFTPGVSDIRVKNEKRVIDVDEALAFIEGWESIVYSLKWTPDTVRVGFRAQDIYKRFPELIERSPLMDVDSGGMLEDGMIVNVAETAAAYLLPVVQQLLQRVSVLEGKLNQQDAQL